METANLPDHTEMESYVCGFLNNNFTIKYGEGDKDANPNLAILLICKGNLHCFHLAITNEALEEAAHVCFQSILYRSTEEVGHLYFAVYHRLERKFNFYTCDPRECTYDLVSTQTQKEAEASLNSYVDSNEETFRKVTGTRSVMNVCIADMRKNISLETLLATHPECPVFFLAGVDATDTSPSRDSILCALTGVWSSEGIVLVTTTNSIGRLDSALIRRGCFDTRDPPVKEIELSQLFFWLYTGARAGKDGYLKKLRIVPADTKVGVSSS